MEEKVAAASWEEEDIEAVVQLQPVVVDGAATAAEWQADKGEAAVTANLQALALGALRTALPPPPPPAAADDAPLLLVNMTLAGRRSVEDLEYALREDCDRVVERLFETGAAYHTTQHVCQLDLRMAQRAHPHGKLVLLEYPAWLTERQSTMDAWVLANQQTMWQSGVFPLPFFSSVSMAAS
jgi:hypothetical protein